jgi:hypothetical protein
MTTWLSKNAWDILNICLITGIFWQFLTLYAPSSILPILTEDSPPRSLHAPKAVDKALFQKIERIGTPINVEDIIRELHRRPELLDNSPNIKQHLVKMQTTQKELLQSEERIISLETELNQLTLKMIEKLSLEQKQKLLDNRNLDSVNKIEGKYWEELIQGTNKQ